MIQPWIVRNSSTEVKNRIFTVKTNTAVSPRTGKEHQFYILEAGTWVNVIPVTPEGRVLLVRQFRHGTNEITLEIPGGLVEDGQTPEQAAARELMEETGFECETLSFLGRVRPNPAIINNWCYSYLARDVVYRGRIKQDDTEDLELLKVKLSEIPQMITNGEIDHALVLSAFYFFMNRPEII